MIRVSRSLTALVLGAALCCAAPASARAADALQDPIRLDNGWEYLPDPGDRGLGLELFNGSAGTGWQTVRVPHLFQPRPVEEGFFGTVGWYRLRFSAPPARAGTAWMLRFEQVRRTTQAWLNGAPIGANRDPYVPFTLPTPGLRPGENTLVLRVDNRKGKEPREGWWNWGGIARPVSLVPTGALVTHSPGFLSLRTCSGDSCRWRVLVDAVVENRGARIAQPRLTVTLRAPGDGGETPVGRRTRAARMLAPGERARVRFAIPVPGDPQVWSPASPRLYDIELRTRDGAAVQQVDRARIGLRKVAVRNGLLRLNDRPLDMRGASLQEDAAGHGAALTDADIESLISELKELGANVTRAHYALDERLLRRLDEEGILVWSQAPIYHRDRLLETAPQRAAALATVKATVLAARNHPSVITHSVANELSVIPDEVPGTRRFLEAALELERDLDPTLPPSVDLLSYPGYPRQRTYARYPLLGINSYFGWYPGKEDHSTAEVADLAPYLRTMRQMYPDQAMVLTEFGAESTMDGPPNVKETFAFQADYVRRVLDIVDRSPWMGGAIYWTLKEFAVKPDWDGGAKRVGVERDGIHNKGLISYDGKQRKPAWQVARQDFDGTPLYLGEADVAQATRVPMPADSRGAGGALLGLALLALIALLLAVDLWAFLGLREAARDEARERRASEEAARRARSEATALRIPA